MGIEGMIYMINVIKSIVSAIMVNDKELVDTHHKYYTLYFYHVVDRTLSTKRTSSTWYATIPSTWKGKAVVRTAVRLDRRMYDGDTTICGHEITVHGNEHKHLVRTARKVRL